MKKFRSTIISVVLLLSQLYSQDIWPSNPHDQVPWIADSLNHKNNFYDFNDNPASLFEDETGKQLWIGHISDYNDGAFHHPFEPESNYNQRYFVQTFYPIDENNLFKGFFTYTRQNDNDVLWADQNRNLDWNPYIFADSSTGDFELSGLSWAGEWAHRITSNWLAGATFYYNVDQRLKQVFPKPLNSHRDIITKAGTQYQKGRLSLGASYQYKNEQEQVELNKYNLNQDLTPLIYKFRYSDLPLILRGKTSEERKSELLTHQFNLQGRLIKDSWSLMLAGFYSQASAENIDGGSRNDKQGQTELVSLGSRFKLERDTKKTRMFLNYDYRQSRLEAEHPEFELTTIKHQFSQHNIRSGCDFKFSLNTSVFAELVYSYLNNQYEDRMTDNFWEYARSGYGATTGIKQRFGPRWSGLLWAGYSGYNYFDRYTEETIYTEYFDILYNEKLNYLTGLRNSNCLGTRITYEFLPVFEFDFNATWFQVKGKQNNRNNIYLGVITKIYIF